MNIRNHVFAGLKKRIKSILQYDRNRLIFLGNDLKENDLGKLQKDESIFLYGLLKVMRPRTVVEFGFLEGYSASVILSALDVRSRLHSFDNAEGARHRAISFSKDHANFSFHFKSQEDFETADIGGALIDFVLMDASHDLELNQRTFEKIKGLLHAGSMLMIHDTGLWEKKFMDREHFTCLESTEHKWLDTERVAHQVNERRFVNWIIAEHTGFATIHVGSTNVLRHGFSLIGSSDPLEV